MRAGDADFEISEFGDGDSWRINIAPGHAWKQRGAWGTPFSCFRYAIPELCSYEGRAVYLDADMLVRSDVRELLETPLNRGFKCCFGNRTDVSVIDCAWFEGKAWWPRISQMKPSGMISWHYVQMLKANNALDVTLDERWNVCDKPEWTPDPGLGDAKLLHQTTVPTQSYKPYPTVQYSPHPWASWVEEWVKTDAEAKLAQVAR